MAASIQTNGGAYQSIDDSVDGYGSTCMDLKILAEIAKAILSLVAYSIYLLFESRGLFFLLSAALMAVAAVLFILLIPFLAVKQLFDAVVDLKEGNFLRATAGLAATVGVFALAIGLKEIALASVVMTLATGGFGAVPLLIIGAVALASCLVSSLVKWAVDSYQAKKIAPNQTRALKERLVGADTERQTERDTYSNPQKFFRDIPSAFYAQRQQQSAVNAALRGVDMKNGC